MSHSLQRLRDYHADTAIILGSGLGSIVGEAPNDQLIPYSDFSEIPEPTVPGHAGRFVFGKIDNHKIIFAQGRVHLYEGHSARDVTSIVRILAEAGVKQVIVTNAAGSLNPKFKPGEWMVITDHINLTGTSPLLLWRQESPSRISDGPNFLDMTDAYSSHLREKFGRAAQEIDMLLQKGIYAGILGPQYETPSEVRTLQKLGADAVGMSTVLEVIQARALGLEVAGFSYLTNLASGLSEEKVSHDQVLKAGKKAAADFARLLNAALS